MYLTKKTSELQHLLANTYPLNFLFYALLKVLLLKSGHVTNTQPFFLTSGAEILLFILTKVSVIPKHADHAGC